MLRFLCKRLLPKWRAMGDSAKTRLNFIQNTTLYIKPFSSSSKNIKSAIVKDQLQQSFTVSYLINSCGLPLETAISASHKVHFETPKRPDSVLTLLRGHGFTNTQISRLVKISPDLLLAKPQKTLLPRLEFLRSIGISSTDIAMILSSTPCIFRYSLENRLMPWYNFLKSLPLNDKDVVKAMKWSMWTFKDNVQQQFALNISALREVGVPESCVLQIVKFLPALLCRNRDRFDKIVKEVIEMGYNPKKTEFVGAMHLFSWTTKSSRERTMEVYRRCGWSEDDVQVLFKKYPLHLFFSEKKITSAMDFLVNKMGCQIEAITRCPLALAFSLEKRVIPRCSVIKVLQLKGLIKKDLNLSNFLKPTEKYFLDKFVTKYQEDIPQLLNVYQRKMNHLELDFGSEEICGMKQL